MHPDHFDRFDSNRTPRAVSITNIASSDRPHLRHRFDQFAAPATTLGSATGASRPGVSLQNHVSRPVRLRAVEFRLADNRRRRGEIVRSNYAK